MSHLVWEGWTEDGPVAISRDRRGETLWRGGAAVGTWPFVAESSLATAGAHLAFAVRDREGWRVVADGVPGRSWEAVAEVRVARDGGVAALVRDGAGWWLATPEGNRGPWRSARRGLRWDDGGRFAVAVEDVDGVRVVEPSGAGPAWVSVGELVATAGGAAYVARDGGDFVVVDGTAHGPWGAAGDLATCGPHVAWVADDHVWQDGWDLGPGGGPIAFLDGCRPAWVAGDALVIDGEERYQGADPRELRVAGAHWAIVDGRALVVDGAVVARAGAFSSPAVAPDGAWAALSLAVDGTRVHSSDGDHGPYDVVADGALVRSERGWWWVAGTSGSGWSARSTLGDVLPFDIDRWLVAAGPAGVAPLAGVRAGLARAVEGR